ncbi:hypothetical protein BKA64DRAFT_641830 [Cadophora sp. MPI-SDFR-AT-0126]|nr:hypothetical protein BKA64DRAFT_641830 [Leotiomycetes sp. MPI-SDFR-AT-0126]
MNEMTDSIINSYMSFSVQKGGQMTLYKLFSSASDGLLSMGQDVHLGTEHNIAMPPHYSSTTFWWTPYDRLIVHLQAKSERSEILAVNQTTEHLQVIPKSVPAYQNEEKNREGIKSTCHTAVECQEQPGISPPTTPPTKFPDFFEPAIDSTTPQLDSLKAKKEALTTGLADSFLVVEFQSEMKRAAMEFYFAHLRGADTGPGSDRCVGQATYLKARQMYSDVLKVHKEKEEILMGLVSEIGRLEGMVRAEREMGLEMEKEDWRGSGETLVEGNTGIGGWYRDMQSGMTFRFDVSAQEYVRFVVSTHNPTIMV